MARNKTGWEGLGKKKTEHPISTWKLLLGEGGFSQSLELHKSASEMYSTMVITLILTKAYPQMFPSSVKGQGHKSVHIELSCFQKPQDTLEGRGKRFTMF